MNELNKNQLIQKINLENKITNIETFSTFILLFEFLFKKNLHLSQLLCM